MSNQETHRPGWWTDPADPDHVWYTDGARWQRYTLSEYRRHTGPHRVMTPPTPPPPPVRTPPAPRMPPPPAPQPTYRYPGPLAYNQVAQRRQGPSRRLWWALGGAFTVLVLIAAAVSDPKTTDTAASSTEPTTTEAPAAPVATERPATTAAPTTAAPATEAAETVPAELAEETRNDVLFYFLEKEINPKWGTAYALDPDAAVAIAADPADALCEAAAKVDTAEQFSLGLLLAYNQIDPADLEIWGGDLESFAKASGYLLAWRCPEQSDRIYGT